MPGFVLSLLFFLLLAGVFLTLLIWGIGKAPSVDVGRNRLLFAIVILLFAILFKLVSSGIDWMAFIIAVVGLVVGWSGVRAEQPSAESSDEQAPEARPTES
ncbi:MAG TPA: hypothetical protein VE338_00235 [Ktedonobacterales bacterium]|jgi:hypothetical protein|nr:hypothetical protein [Ktedonobacterales bacterium]